MADLGTYTAATERVRPLLFEGQHCLLDLAARVLGGGLVTSTAADSLLVEMLGVEPGTFCVQSKRFTVEPHGRSHDCAR